MNEQPMIRRYVYGIQIANHEREAEYVVNIPVAASFFAENPWQTDGIDRQAAAEVEKAVEELADVTGVRLKRSFWVTQEGQYE